MRAKSNRRGHFETPPGLQPLDNDKDHASMTLYVRYLNGDTMTLTNVFSTMLVAEIALRIEELNQIPLSGQWIIYPGKQLACDKSLADYNIPDKGICHMVPRWKGS